MLSGRTVLGEDVVSTPGTTFSFTATGEQPQQVTLFTPVVDDGHGPRHADIELRSMRIDGRPVPVPTDRLAHRLLPPDRLSYLRSYDQIAPNSTFTAGWVQRLWGRTSDILYPPVNPVAPAPAKEPIILSLGRFFDPAYGHCKKQLELAQAFRSLVERGTDAPAGSSTSSAGCRPRTATTPCAVRAEAQGLPIHVHMNATGATVADLLARASIYSARRRPGRGPRGPPRSVRALRHRRGRGPVRRRRAGRVRGRRAGRDRRARGQRPALRRRPRPGRRHRAPARRRALRRRLADGARGRAEHFGPTAFRKRLFELVS